MSAPFAGRVARNFRQDHAGDCQPDKSGYCPCPLETTTAESADLICSDLPGGRHMPVVDLDLPVALIPSGTPGHFHLYIDKAVTWDQYLGILRAMADAGIVQPGYVSATEARGFGALRHPDRPKTASTEMAPF